MEEEKKTETKKIDLSRKNEEELNGSTTRHRGELCLGRAIWKRKPKNKWNTHEGGMMMRDIEGKKDEKGDHFSFGVVHVVHVVHWSTARRQPHTPRARWKG